MNSFWDSRKRRALKKRPEKLGQELLALFAYAKLSKRGSLVREPVSGIGFVDVLVTLSSGLVHVVELKVLRDNDVVGVGQLATYLKHKRRCEGWLVLFDARDPGARQAVPSRVVRGSYQIKTVLIDINPVAPSRKL